MPTDAGAPPGEAFELAAGVVVAPSPPAIYLARPSGGIEALDPVSGEPMWSSEEATRPLLVHGGRLLAQRESGSGLPLAILDAADGRLLRRLEAALPEGVRATVVESLESRFTISARVVGEEALIEWEYLERDVLGVSPPGGRPFARRELGALRLDLETAETRPVDRGEPTAAADEPLPPPVERLVVSGELRLPPWRAGEVLAAAQQLYDPGRERLVLRRWRADTGEALPEVTLLEGRAVAVLPAGDRRHLLVVAPPEALPEAAGRYLWTIHSLATGEAVSSRRAERSATPFCLLGDTLVYLEPPSGRRVEGRWVEAPLRLRAIGPDGVELWQEEVRDPAFRGPAPPRQ